MRGVGTRATGAVCVFVCAASIACASDPSRQKWEPWLELGGRIGDTRSLGEGNLFAPLIQTHNSLVFADFRGMFDDQDAAEGNLGLGIRRMLPNGWNVGAYGYYDVRRSSFHNVFHQITFGAEALSQDVDLRANVYLPIGRRQETMDLGTTTATVVGTPTAVLTGTSLAIETQTTITTTSAYQIEKALAGFDAEIGFRLPVFDVESKLDLRAFAGGYYFDASNVEKVAGPRLRLELTAQDLFDLDGVKLTAGLMYQNDDLRGDQWIGQARIRIPLQAPAPSSSPPLTYMERRMVDTVVRDVDIVSNTVAKANSTSTTTVLVEDAINTWNDEVITSVTYLAGGGGSHSVLQTELDARGAGSVVVLNGGIVATDRIILNQRQTLLGGGTDLLVRGAISGAEVIYTATGAAGSIVGNPASDLVHSQTTNALVWARDYSVIGGLTVTKTGGSGGVATESAAVMGYTYHDGSVFTSANGISLFGNTIAGGSGADAYGVLFHRGRDIKIVDNTINTSTDTDAFALVFKNTATNMLISGNRLNATNAGFGSFRTYTGPMSITFSDNIVGGTTTAIHAVSAAAQIQVGSDNNIIAPGFAGTRCGGVAFGGPASIEFTDGTNCD